MWILSEHIDILLPFSVVDLSDTEYCNLIQSARFSTLFSIKHQ